MSVCQYLYLVLLQIHLVFVIYFCRRSFRRNGNHLGTSSGGVAIRGRGPSIVVSLVRAFGFTFFVGGVLKLFQDLLGFASPQILRCLHVIYSNQYTLSINPFVFEFACIEFSENSKKHEK